MRKQIRQKIIFLLFGLLCLSLFGLGAKPAYASNPSTINFQGKVVNADGTNVSNGSYTFIFRLYDTASPTTTSTCSANGSCWWEETDTITVTNGVFQVELGAVCAFTSACNSSHSGIDFNTNNALYLTSKFNADAAGFMSPTIHLTSFPYALNSDKLGGLTSGNFVQLAQGVQTDVSTTNPSIFINKNNGSGSPNILELQKAGVDVFKVDNTGLITAVQGLTLTGTTLINNSGSASTTIGNSAGGTITIGASSGSDLVLNDANWSVTGSGNATFAQVTSPTYTSSAGLTINSGNNTLTIDSTDTTLSATGLTAINLGAGPTINASSGNIKLTGTATGVSAALFVLPTKTDAGDPTTAQINGGLYYNSSTGKFRCYQNSVWGDCIGAGGATDLPGAYTNSTPVSGEIVITTTDAKSVKWTLADTTTDSNFLVNTATSSTGKFAVQYNGADTFSISNAALAQGSALFKNAADNTNAFQIQNSSGLDIFNVNTNTTANLVSNPSLESNFNGWSKKGAAGVAITSSDEVAAQYGSRELKIVTTAAANDGATFNFQAKPSTAYSISFWAKSTGSTGASISFGHRENTGTGDVDCLTTQTLTTTWTQFTCNNFTTNATVNDTVPTIGIYVKQSDATSRTIYIDGVTMVAAATGLTFDAGGNNFNAQSLNSNITLNNTNTGEIQPWQTNNNALPAVREDAATATSNGFIYDIGGYDGSVGAGTTYYAKMNSDGSTGSWNTGAALPNSQLRRYGSSAVANGYIYVVGGFDTTNTLAANQIFYGKLNSDGTVGTWYCQGTAANGSCGSGATNVANTNNLPTAKVASSVVVSNGFIYVIGGCSDNSATCATPTTTIHYAKLFADGQTGPWTATTQGLTAARGMGSATFANGYIYYIGGYNANPVNTVYYAPIAASGDITTAFSTTGAAALPVARREHSTVIANGYVYTVGGCITTSAGACTAASNVIYYAKLNGDGTYGAWATNTNALPANRASQVGVIANGYIYTIGGYDGAARQATVYYGSTARILLGGTLDLVGLTSQSLGDFGGGGALTAGNGRFIGDLKVDGFVDLNNGLSVDSAINLNAVSSTTGQTVFNINNSSANSIFSIKHMNTSFGSLANGGAFVDNMSYIGQEFSGDARFTATTALGTVGDDLMWNYRTTTVAGTESYSTPRGINGVARVISGATTAKGSMVSLGTLSAAASALDTIIKTSNLPVMQMKFVPVQTGNAFVAAMDYFIGMSDTTTAPTTNDTLPANGVYLWTNNTTAATGGSLTLQGMVRSGSATIGTPVSCTGAYTYGNSITARIQVESTTTARFLIDFNAGDGINFTDCGVVTGTFPTAQLAPQFIAIHTEATARQFDIDYMRIWQDDAPADEGLTTESVPADTTSPATDSTTLPVSVDGVATRADQLGIIDLTTAISEDAVFNKDVYVRGTLYADKIKANQIEGLEVLTDKISSLQDMLAQGKAASATSPTDTSTQSSSASGLDTAGQVSFNNLQAVNLVTLAQIESRGGLVVDKDAQFNGKTIFQLLAEFNGDANFNGNVNFSKQPTFNSDGGGTAIIKAGAQKVQVKFGSPYAQNPVVVANWAVDSDNSADQVRLFEANYNFFVTKVDQKGFWIYLNKPAAEDLKLNWLASAVKDAKISTSEPNAQ